MKKITTLLLLSGGLLFGAVACTDAAKTSADAPDTTNQAAVETPKAGEVKETKEDAQSELRRKQLNSDIRAREERNNALNDGDAKGRSDDNLQSEVRSKLEANIPGGLLTVKSENAMITVEGTVPKQDQLAKIEPLAKQIKGVKGVDVKASVAAPK
ncbi:MAG: BON domain-containing protein [Coleofasciculaceae cyanobacterium]